MRVLFLHNNYPAQFGSLAHYMAKRGHDVTFGTHWEGTPPKWLRMVRYKPHREILKNQHPYLAFVEKAVLNGQGFARAAWKMKAAGYAPDVIVAHSGWGNGLYVRDVWPDAKYVGYFEWYYRSKGADVGFLDEASPDDRETSTGSGRATRRYCSTSTRATGASCPPRTRRRSFQSSYAASSRCSTTASTPPTSRRSPAGG